MDNEKHREEALVKLHRKYGKDDLVRSLNNDKERLQQQIKSLEETIFEEKKETNKEAKLRLLRDSSYQNIRNENKELKKRLEDTRRLRNNALANSCKIELKAEIWEKKHRAAKQTIKVMQILAFIIILCFIINLAL